ncbi:MAG: DUF5596 domain-containing protein [Lentisphaerae bacterium]|nr:DUF5596 domain-containing protein [Lentisphaerota bacterium]
MNTTMPLPSALNEPANIAAFLRDTRRLRAEAAWAGIEPTACDLIVQAADDLLRRPERLADLVHCATTLFTPDAWKAEEWNDVPRDNTAGERFFLILPLLQHLAQMRALYAAHAIPDTVLHDTLADLQIWIDTNQQRSGAPGFREVGWMREHLYCRVIRLGRLQFQPGTFSMPFVVLTHRQRGKTCVVACGAREITSKGIFADSEGATGPFIDLTYVEEAGEIRQAHLVEFSGYLAPRPTTFAPGEWERRLTAGDPVLNLHIPAAAPLDFDACRDSFVQAASFYPRHFPELGTPRAVVCGSWLFNPGLCDILPETSNIVRFQRAFLRVPQPKATSGQTYERAFVPHGRATRREQLTTTLQRRLFDHIAAGHVPLGAGGIFPAPIDAWGTRRD